MATAQAVKIPPSFTKALEFINNKGFSHIKVELEANLHRSGSTMDCRDCRSRGWLRCASCRAQGFTLEGDVATECLECGGDGHMECGACNGRGFTGSEYTDDWCRRFILENVKSETARNIIFSKFYRDGSVDSELTFTMPTLQAHGVIDVFKAFIKLAKAVGSDRQVDTRNAGLHISVLPSGLYPCAPGLLDMSFMRNFRLEVTKLLPALYFLGTHNPYTRGLSYRKPFVSHTEKYSAIYTHGDTAIEYRLFDPCFDKPEAFFDKVEVIAGTLKYYSQDATVKSKYEQFGVSEFSEIAELYNNFFNYDALLETIKEVKPDKTFNSLKAERHLVINKTKLLKFHAEMYQEQLKRHAQYLKYWHNQVAKYTNWLTVPANYFKKPGFARNTRLFQWQTAMGYSDEQLIKSVRLRRKMVMANANVFGLTPEPPKRPKRQSIHTYNSGYSRYVIKPDQPLDEESEEYDTDSY